ncbi:MAG: hypothetical protein SFV81_13795 [Pirellulaceae bacterium]|nr:hypothetical protein [Pirellulaceae bacterium]
MSPEFRELLSLHVGNAFAKQVAFADVLEERNWGISLSQGRATFGDDLAFAIQLIGTEADGDSSWLWAWANEQSNIPESLLRACMQMKTLGEQTGVPELRERSCSQEDADGHMMALIASGLNPDCCYYRGAYEGGALYFLVCDAPNVVTQQVAPERAITVLTEVISQFDVDHRQMAHSFLETQGFDVTEGTLAFVAKRADGSIEIRFDSAGRIVKIEGSVAAAKPKQ